MGKYRGLGLAIALFLILDLGVLGFSFYVSSEIQGDAARINRASELRMFTQQLTKSLLTLREETNAGLPNQTSLAQITQARPVFNSNLKSLEADVTTQQTQWLQRQLLGERLGENQNLLQKLERTWRSFDNTLEPVASTQTPTRDDVDIAANKAVALNIKLAQQADDLAANFEQTAVARATALKTVQIVGIVLATINFVFIVLKFLRSLATSDQRAAAARQETRNILATVEEGLFLIHADGRLSAEQSGSLHVMLGTPVAPELHYRDFFRQFLHGENLELALEYLALLMDGQTSPSLVAQLNPLTHVPVQRLDGSERILKFTFNKVEGRVGEAMLLVTVFDMTETERLAREVENAQQRASAEAESLSELMAAEPTFVIDFVEFGTARLREINDRLRTLPADKSLQRETLDSVFRIVHSIKGQAAALGLRGFSRGCHQVEETLARRRAQLDFGGSDWIPVTVDISRLHGDFTRVEKLIEQLAAYGQRTAQGGDSSDISKSLPILIQLARNVAQDCGKRVEVHIQDMSKLSGDVATRVLHDILPQLIRNAVVHGVETPEERVRQGKPGVGRIYVGLSRDEKGVVVSVRDDGRGIVADRLRQSLSQTGRFSTATIALMDERSLVASLFEPGVSTVTSADQHAGRGVGLDIVKDTVRELGGGIRVMSQPGRYTEFRLSFPLAAHAAEAA